MGNVIPNPPKLFAEPREVLKYRDVERSHAPEAHLGAPPRDIFPVCEEKGRRLFEGGRSWQKLVDDQKVVRRERRIVEEKEVGRKVLFEQPREVMKYLEIPGARPAPCWPTTARRASPTFASSIFS
jgi:hypothetical protein